MAPIRPFAISRSTKRASSGAIGSPRAAWSSSRFFASDTTSFAAIIRDRSGTSPRTWASFSACWQTESPFPVSRT